MAQNKLSDLNNILFETLQNLVNPDVDENNNPINPMDPQKANSVAKIAQVMVNNVKVQVDALKLAHKGHVRVEDLPQHIIGGEEVKSIDK